MKGPTMKRLALALVATAAFLLPIGAVDGGVHTDSSHHAIDWD